MWKSRSDAAALGADGPPGFQRSTTMRAVVSHGRQACCRSQVVGPQPGGGLAVPNKALVHCTHCVGYSTVPSAFSSSSHSCTAGMSETMEKSRSSRLM